jgi:hypothetical protein
MERKKPKKQGKREKKCIGPLCPRASSDQNRGTKSDLCFEVHMVCPATDLLKEPFKRVKIELGVAWAALDLFGM